MRVIKLYRDLWVDVDKFVRLRVGNGICYADFTGGVSVRMFGSPEECMRQLGLKQESEGSRMWT